MITYSVVILLVFFFSSLAELTKRRVVLDNGLVCYEKTQVTKLFLFLVMAILIFTAGCRYYVGTDYGNYVRLYYTYSRMTWDQLFSIDEPIIPLIGNLSYRLFDSCYSMFFIASLITIGLILYSSYKETTDFIFVTLLFIFVGNWTGSFNGVRQYLAVAIVFAGRHYIEQRKFIKFLLICFIAFLAHESALFFIPIYFLYSKKVTVRKLILVTLIAVLISRSYGLIFDFIGWMSNEEFVPNEYVLNSVNILRILAGCAPALVAIFCAYTRKLDKRQIFYVYMLVANAAMGIATADSAYLARLTLYTGVFVPLGLNSIYKSCDKLWSGVLRIITVVLYFAFWLYEVLISKDLRNFEWIFGRLQ